MSNIKTMDNMKTWVLRWTNYSGHTFEGLYTEGDANALFDWYCKSNAQVEIVPPTGQTYSVYNAKLGKCFDCWK